MVVEGWFGCNWCVQVEDLYCTKRLVYVVAVVIAIATFVVCRFW